MFLGQLAAMLERRRLTTVPSETPRAWRAHTEPTADPGAAASRKRGRWPISITRLEVMAAARSALPFSLTGAQERVLADIVSDLAGPSVMMRLLQVAGLTQRGLACLGLSASPAVQSSSCNALISRVACS